MSSYEDALAELTRQFKTARDDIAKADHARTEALRDVRTDVDKIKRIVDDLTPLVGKHQALQTAIEVIAKKLGRPTGGLAGDDIDIDKSAHGLLQLKHGWKHPTLDGSPPFEPSSAEIEEARHAIAGLQSMLRTRDTSTLPEVQRKALSAFAIGSSGFLLPVEMSGEILSCLSDETDVAGLVRNQAISGSSIKFLIETGKIDAGAAWACETDCFANNPTNKDLASLLGELEIRPEALRYILCATRELIDDADFGIDEWLQRKVSEAFRDTISNAIISGDGMGKPIGILNPQSGIPICETSTATVAGQFNWQDLVMLKYALPAKYLKGGQFWMNQHSFALTLTMSDAMGRPIMIASPVEGGQFMIAGSPVSIVTQMPNVQPGATPVAYGDWSAAYMAVHRKAVTMQQDPFSAGFCVLFKFEARVGGGVICANAARLMRVR